MSEATAWGWYTAPEPVRVLGYRCEGDGGPCHSGWHRKLPAAERCAANLTRGLPVVRVEHASGWRFGIPLRSLARIVPAGETVDATL